jgi:pSer/pThr/pTyr-binding forkhead associated (FHA) protein
MGPDDDTTLTFVPAEINAQHGPETDADLRLAMPEVAHGTGVLVVKRGPNAGSRFVLEADVTRAGRHPESDIFLDDITVSRRHAEFVARGPDFVVRDVGSLNGTYLNRERIEEAQLASGDEVQIGKFKLVFIAGPPREQ